MTKSTEIMTFDARHERIRTGLILNLEVPPDHSSVRRLDRAVIAIVRAGGGAGADTLASLIAFLAGPSVPKTLIDFSLEGDEGPAWDETNTEFKCRRVELSADLGADIANAIDENPEGIVIINTPPNFLLDLVAKEPEFRLMIHQFGRPYILIWIDSLNDQPIDRLGEYLGSGGTARCIVAVRESDHLRGEPRKVNIELIKGVPSPITIPRLSLTIQSQFHQERRTLREAVEAGRLGDQLSFHVKLKRFAAEIGDVL